MTISARPPSVSLAAAARWLGGLGLAAFATFLLFGASAAPGERVVRQPNESVAAFAHRLLPPKWQLAADPVELELSPLGKVVVVLARPEGSASNYTGWVLAPEKDGSYRKNGLPPLALAEGLFDVEPMSIFRAQTPAAATPVLCVLYSYYRTGSGEEGGYATEVYAWRTDAFASVPEVAQGLTGLKDAGSVRARLKAASAK